MAYFFLPDVDYNLADKCPVHVNDSWLLLLVVHRLQRFLADFRDLTSWVTEMKALINADELANDVAGAEALLDRHQEHKVIIVT